MAALMKSKTITKPEHAVVTQGQVNGLVDHISALISGLDQRVTESVEEIEGRAIGILRAAEQDARTQDAVLLVKLEVVERWAVAGCGIAAVALLVAAVALLR